MPNSPVMGFNLSAIRGFRERNGAKGGGRPASKMESARPTAEVGDSLRQL